MNNYFKKISGFVLKITIAFLGIIVFAQGAAAGPGNTLPVFIYHTLNYSAGAHGTLVGTASQMVTAGSNGTVVKAVPDTGYVFDQWSDGVTTASRTETNVQSSLNVTAFFTLAASSNLGNVSGTPSYTLTYTAGSHGSLTGATSQTVVSGSNGTLVKAVPNSGYAFSSWSDGVPTASRTDTNITANKSVTAYFVQQPTITNVVATYTLNYIAGPHGSITGNTYQSITSGSNGTLVKAVPSSGYAFDYWSDGVTTASRTDTNVYGNQTLTAYFKKIISSSGGGGGSSSSGNASSAASILGSGTCPFNLTISNKLKEGARDGQYLAYNQGIVTQVIILQKQINRILAASYNQAAGPEDGIFGPKTKLGVQRLQIALMDILGADLGPKGPDGIVGPFTKAAINNSCGGM